MSKKMVFRVALENEKNKRRAMAAVAGWNDQQRCSFPDPSWTLPGS